MPRQSLAEYLEYFDRYGSDVACVHGRGYRRVQWRYRELANAAAHFARELEAREIRKGDRVLLWGENCGEWIIAFWGCLLRGVAVVPMDRAATPEFAARVARQVDAKLLVHSFDLPALDKLPSLTFEALMQTLERHSLGYRAAGCSRTDVAEIVFTSGTTAEPKGVVLTHGNLLANLEPLEREIEKYRRYERIVHPLRFVNLLPLSHVFGQFMGLLIPPLIGATVVFQETLNPSEVIRTIKRERASVLVAVPHMLDSLKGKLVRDLETEGRLERFRRRFAAAEKERFWKRWWRFRRVHWRFGWKFWAVVSGGAALGDETETFWSRLGFAVIQGYGLTETASLISLNHPFQLSKGSIGKSLPGREMKLGENGEILVRGESISSAYWQGKEMRPVAGDEGWFRTGDAGALDATGNLFFKGRLKNVLVTPAGMNIYPEDLEAALRSQPEVRDCIVVGLSRDGNEEACAVLLLREGGDAAEAVRRANESLAEYQKIRNWYVWPSEDFPRTSTQKPRVNVIREAVEADLSRNAAQSGLSRGSVSQQGVGSLEELITRITRQSQQPISPSANLATDLNLSSLDRVELLSAIEDRYQVELNEAQFSSATTVQDLEQLLRQPASNEGNYPSARWAQRWPVRVVRAIVYYLLAWPATVLMAWPRVSGRENLRGLRGPALFIANHVTEIDAAFVIAALPLRFRHKLAIAMVGERLRDLRRPPSGSGIFRRVIDPVKYLLVTALFNVFPMPKQSGVRGSFQYAGESVDRGYSLLVFPEGQLTKDGGIGAFRSGIGGLASKLDLPVVPVRIDGLYELRQGGKRFARPGSVRVTIGAPVRFGREADPEQIAEQLRGLVLGMTGN